MTTPTAEDPSDRPAWTEDHADDERLEFEPWITAYADEQSAAQVERIDELSRRPGYELHPRCVIALGAHVVADRLAIGEHSTVAAGCVLRGDVTIGSHCSLNAGTSTIGRVSIGNLVRIATGVVLVGENHGFDDLEMPIAVQPMTSVGVTVGDDVWIGANVTVVDGVTIGSHSIVAAGAVVTRDVALWSIVGGVPARPIGDRRTRRHERSTGTRRPTPDPLARFDARVAEQWPEVIERCRTVRDGVPTVVDGPGSPWGPRALNDAVEIAGAFGSLPPRFGRHELIERIGSSQDPTTGLFIDPTLGPPPDPEHPLAPTDREWDMYGHISCGYALEVLGSGPPHRIEAIESCTADQLTDLLDGLDHDLLAWPSGSWIDGFGTGVYLNARHHGSTRSHSALWEWLDRAVHRSSGMWGTYLEPLGDWDFRWLMAVNGYYRLTRGTFAQFGLPLPHPHAAIDTVLAHCRDYENFASVERNACNVLDIIHPLWMLSRQVEHRAAEIRQVAADVLSGAIADWVDGEGMAWEVGRDQPGLQGTEMWLSVVYLAADVLGESGGLSWRPRGVHRLEPAAELPRSS